MFLSAGLRVTYIYKYDDNTYWNVSSYIDDFGRISPIVATNYTYGIR